MGEWAFLEKHLQKNTITYSGIDNFDTACTLWKKALTAPSGQALKKAHNLYLSNSYEAALAVLSPLVTGNDSKVNSSAKHLESLILKEVEKCIYSYQEMMIQGYWYNLKSELSRNRSAMDTIPLFKKNMRTWEQLLNSSSGKALIAADKLLQSEKAGSAAKALIPAIKDVDSTEEIKAVVRVIQDRIRRIVDPALIDLLSLEKEGDWYTLNKNLLSLKSKLSGASTFDEKYDAYRKKVRSREVKSIISAGKKFEVLKKQWKKSKNKTNTSKLKTFIKAYPDTLYGKKASELLKKM